MKKHHSGVGGELRPEGGDDGSDDEDWESILFESLVLQDNEKQEEEAAEPPKKNGSHEEAEPIQPAAVPLSAKETPLATTQHTKPLPHKRRAHAKLKDGIVEKNNRERGTPPPKHNNDQRSPRGGNVTITTTKPEDERDDDDTGLRERSITTLIHGNSCVNLDESTGEGEGESEGGEGWERSSVLIKDDPASFLSFVDEPEAEKPNKEKGSGSVIVAEDPPCVEGSEGSMSQSSFNIANLYRKPEQWVTFTFPSR